MSRGKTKQLLSLLIEANIIIDILYRDKRSLEKRVQELGESGISTMGRKIAYVAGPYRANSKIKIIKNIIAARKVSKELWKMGYVAICPHSNSGLFSEVPEEDFLNGDIELLKKSDLVVLVPGWENSIGTQAEIAAAVENNIEIFVWENNELSELKLHFEV